MEDQLRESDSTEPMWGEFAETLTQHQQRAEKMLATESERIQRLESSLDDQVRQLCAESERLEDQLQHREQELDRRENEIAQQVEHLQELRTSLTEAQAQWHQLQLETAKQQEALLSELRDKHTQLDDKRTELESLREAALQQASAGEVDPSILMELEQLRAERRQLLQRVEEAEAAGTGGAASEDPAAAEQIQQLEQRLEMAMGDLRELKKTNEDLEQQLVEQAAAAPVAGFAGAIPGGPMDWEAQKQQMLAQLENEGDGEGDQEEDVERRLELNQVIRATDKLVSDKQGEIDELKKLLDHQSNNIGDVAVGAAAIGEMLGQDELVVQERESLRQMQDEWRAKMRKAEVEISMERAQLARERMELEEKSLMIKRSQPAQSNAPAEESKQASKKHWLARLGLIENDEG